MNRNRHSRNDYPTAQYLHLFDDNLWEKIDPLATRCQTNLELSPKIIKKTTKKEKKVEKKERREKRIKDLNRIPIKNKQYSFTSFLIPICITGEKKDYQLLYCICALKNALKILSTTLRKEGFAQLYMVGMKSQVDWEKIKTNRVSFSDVITDFLLKSGAVCMVAINKKEVLNKVNNRDAPFVVLASATDIPLPCQKNLCVGTSWIIFRRSEQSRVVLFDREIYQPGRRAVHAGLMLNGCSTRIVAAFKRVVGIHHFIFDTRFGDFVMLNKNCFLRHTGNAICINEGRFYKFDKKVQDWLLKKKLRDQEYYSRYTGGWLTDGYRILVSGGLLLSPEDNESNEGWVKFLFKAVPMAFLVEKAGGKATNGRKSILNLKTEKSGYTTLALGSIENVDSYMEMIKEDPIADKFVKPISESDSDDTSTDFE